MKNCRKRESSCSSSVKISRSRSKTVTRVWRSHLRRSFS